MPSPAQCEFVLLRYVPDAIKNEFINIGVVLIENSGNGQARARFARDWRRVQCLDPDADIAMLQALAAEIQRHAETAAGRGSLLEHIQESCSNLIQIAEPKACLAPSPALELLAIERRIPTSR